MHKAGLCKPGEQACAAGCINRPLSRRLTEDGDDFVVLDDLERAGDDEAEAVDALARVVQEITGRRVAHGKMHGERSQAAVAGESEGGMLVEHFAI